MGRRDSLLLLVQSGMDVAIAALPGLSKPSKALLAKVSMWRACRCAAGVLLLLLSLLLLLLFVMVV